MLEKSDMKIKLFHSPDGMGFDITAEVHVIARHYLGYGLLESSDKNILWDTIVKLKDNVWDIIYGDGVPANR